VKQFSKKQRGKAASSRKSAKVSNGRPEAAISKMTKRVVAVSLVVPVATSAMLAVGFSPAQAATVSYFDNIATSGSVSATDPSGPNSLTLPIYYNTGTTSITRSDTAADNLLFSPTWVTNSYSEVVLTSPAVVPGSTSTFTITTSPPSSAPTSFGLTLAAGSNAGNISKSDYPLYHTAVPAGPVIVFGNPTGTYISTSTSPYTANLTFNGVNAVSGYTDIDGGNITINGGVTFAGTVQAGGIDINTESLVTFNSQLDLSPGADHSLRFHDAGNVSLNGGLTGNILYSGNNAIVSLSNGSISGNVGTSVAGTGTLIFGDGTLAQSVGGYIGSADGLTTIHEIRLDGMGGVTVGSSTNRVAADHINFNTATTLNLNGNLNTSSRSGRIDFNNLAGTLNIANGVTGYADVVSTGGTNGTVNFEESGALTGNIGTSTSSRISDVNIGTSAAGAVTMTGNLYATTLDISKGSALDITGNVTAATTLNYNSGSHATLRVTDGDVTGPVTTANNGFGILTLTGGSGANGTANTQVVSGTVGNSTNHLWIINAAATGMTSNFTNPAAIYANSFNVTGTGTANLSGGLEGSLSYLDDGTVNLATGKGITGTVSTSSNNYGILVLNGGTQSISGNIGSAALRLKEVDADASGATTTFGGDVNATTFNAAGASGSTVVNGATYATTVNVGAGTGTFKGLVTATTLNVTTGTANLDGGLTGNLDFDDNGFAVLAAGQTLTGNVTNSSATPRGTLTLSGSGTVTGSIGSATNAISTINAGADGTASQLNSAGGMTYASTLQFTGNGTVLLSGQNGGNAVGGLVGTVDFGTNVTSIGTLQIGDNVNLTTGASGIQFRDANGSTLRFLGTSTVAGNLGAAATGATLANSTLGSIYAGAAGETVTFNGDVHVAGSTFHVNAGTVNLNGDLYGPLVFDADGVAIVADGKSIKDDGTAALGTVSTATDNTGTLNYLGDTTLSHDLGTSANKLKAVSFHSDAAVAAVIQDIGQNVYAYTTTIGNATTATTANITATNLFLGDSLTLAASNVTLNTAGAVAVSGGSVVFDHAKNANGTLANLATVTKSTIGTGVMTTNGATMNFVVSSSPWNATNGGGIIDAATSSSITGEAGSSLVMTGTETVNLSLLGSLKNGQTLRMIDVAGGADTHIASTLNDNSYVIKTEFSRDGGDLVVWAVRDASTYIAQSGTSGHFSNNAASSLGALAASGTGYSEDMQTVLNKLDIDQWGYGNNAANLATQVERLAPIANASVSETTFNANTLALNTVEGRLAALRGDGKQVKPGKYSTWLKGFAGFIKQTAKEMYDGYRSSTTGSAIGADTRITDSLVGGLSLAYSDSEIKQDDFRVGDKTNAKAWQGSVYSSLDVTDRLYLEGTFAYADDQYKGQRRTAIDRTADSDFGGSQLTGRVAAGYRINLDSMQTLTPMVSMQWSRLNLDGYTETGADALNLKVDSQKLTSNRLGLGMRYGLETRSKGLTFRPEVSATWFNDSGDRNKAVVASYAGGGSSFATPVAGLEKHSYTIGAGLSVLTDNNSGVALNYDYTAASGAWAHDVQLVGRIAF
jgi:uncharacterized protein with beta-barrel porin domain